MGPKVANVHEISNWSSDGINLYNRKMTKGVIISIPVQLVMFIFSTLSMETEVAGQYQASVFWTAMATGCKICTSAFRTLKEKKGA